MIFIFLIYSLIYAEGFQQYVTTKFVQLHYFLSQTIGGTKDIVFPLSKRLGDRSPSSPLKLGP